MKLIYHCSTLVALSTLFCQIQGTPSHTMLALSGAANGALALVSGYASYKIAKTALWNGEIAECWTKCKEDYTLSVRGNKSLIGTFTYQYKENGRRNIPHTILRPCAYASLLYLTSRVAVERGRAAYTLLKEAYTGKKREKQKDTTSPAEGEPS